MKNEFDEFFTCLNSNGCFLTSGNGDKINTMTIGWGFAGAFCNKDVIIVPVRKSRYTKEFIDKYNCFSVSIPNGMSKELAFCGTNSGRDIDKFKALNMTAVKCKSIESVVIGGCKRYYECNVMLKTAVELECLPEEIRNRFYSNADEHILYFGEIVDRY